MSDNLVIGGATFSGVTGIKATDTNDNVVTFESGGGGEWTTTGILNGTEPNGAVSTQATSIAAYALAGKTAVTSISAPLATNVGNGAFQGCTGLTSVSLPLFNSNSTALFNGCNALTVIGAADMPSARYLGQNMFSGCTNLQTLVLPSVRTFYSDFLNGSNNLAVLDIGYTAESTDGRISSSLGRANSLTTIILRRATMYALSHTNWFNYTPFAANGTGGTIYVPQSLLESYTNGTNWSTLIGRANNQILPIEGSIYETQYADGTPIPTT